MSAVLLCERFSFYLLVSLFVLYLNEHFGITEGSAAKYFGYFIGISYFAPILGGALADRQLGYIRSAVIGSLFLALGYFLLGTHARPGFMLGLIAIATGQGLFKPSAMTIISNLYAPSDLRRDSAYSIAYLCSNLGALLSPIVGEALLARAGGLGAFSAAGAMQLVGSLILLGYRNALTEQRQSAAAGPATPQPVPIASPRERAQALTILSMSMMAFWLVYNQLNSTLLFWARDSTNRLLLGHEIPVPYFAAIPSVLVITVTPILLKILASLRKIKRRTRNAHKTNIRHDNGRHVLFGSGYCCAFCWRSSRKHALATWLLLFHEHCRAAGVTHGCISRQPHSAKRESRAAYGSVVSVDSCWQRAIGTDQLSVVQDSARALLWPAGAYLAAWHRSTGHAAAPLARSATEHRIREFRPSHQQDGPPGDGWKHRGLWVRLRPVAADCATEPRQTAG
jgi:dipeptide/tripeptide permease